MQKIDPKGDPHLEYIEYDKLPIFKRRTNDR